MEYLFNETLETNGLFSAKHAELKEKFGKEDLIPLWVADMDLPVARPIVEAMEQRVKKAVFGYTTRPDSYTRAICAWQKVRNGWEIQPDLMSFSPGVIPSICVLLEEFTQPEDKILFFSPVYPEFFNAVKNNGRQVLTSTLQEENGKYSIDFYDLEEKLKEKPAYFLLCHPHNPIGRVWTREELLRIGNLCLQYGVMVISDEIHADLLLWGNKQQVFANLKEDFAKNTITCISATKSFNLAGIQASTAIFPNKEIKARFDAFWHRFGIRRNNCFSIVAVEAAYTHGGQWLEQLLGHLESNMLFVQNYLQTHIPEIKAALPQCTYLMWLDCRDLRLGGDALAHFMIEEAGLAMSSGASFGPGGEGFMRMNVACPIGTLEQAMTQLKTAVEKRRG